MTDQPRLATDPVVIALAAAIREVARRRTEERRRLRVMEGGRKAA